MTKQMLYNRTSHQKLQAYMLVENDQRITLSFYRYFVLNDPQGFRDKLYQEMNKLQVLGRIYIATEGINAQISVSQKYFSALQDTINNYHQLAGVRLNLALEDNGKSFWVLQIKVRPYILADGINNPTFNQAKVGNYLNAEEVNILAEDPNVLFIDMRNHYEYEVGHFYNAIEIPSDTFREQLQMAVNMLQHYKDRKIVMYCTGGIRCEKASAWLLHNGFNDVSQVDGGIIGYVRSARTKGLPIKFIGKNFVFDARLGERVTPDVIAHCHQCDTYCDNHTNCHNKRCNVLFIQCCDCAQQYQYCCSLRCQQQIYFSLATPKLLRTEQKNSIKNLINTARVACL